MLSQEKTPERVFFLGSDFLRLESVTRQIYLAVVTGSAKSSEIKMYLHIFMSKRRSRRRCPVAGAKL